MERKKKIIVAVAAVLVLMVGLMAWKKSETKLSGRYKTDQSTQYIYMLPEEFVFENGVLTVQLKKQESPFAWQLVRIQGHRPEDDIAETKF